MLHNFCPGALLPHNSPSVCVLHVRSSRHFMYPSVEVSNGRFARSDIVCRHLVVMLFLSAGSCGYNHNQALIPSSMVARLPPDSSLIFLDCRVDESVIKFSHIGVTSCCRCKECVEPSSSSLRCECRTVSVKRAPPSPHKTTLCVTDDRLLCPS